jgi:pimeloyl-ACP methyl ester carboxylesterase
MGAFSALNYAAKHADQIAGLYLMAPYPGTADVLAEIRAAGGAATWCQNSPDHQDGFVDEPEDERLWWRWLGRESIQGERRTPVYFGTGSADRFLRGQQLLADVLPKDHVRVLPGKHQWPTWQALWADWLDHGPLNTGATSA